MGLNSFLKSLYLGDRFCQSIQIDSLNNRVKVGINRISRLADGTTSWNFDTSGDIDNGFLVFDGIKELTWRSENGGMPNDAIFSIEVVRETDGSSEVRMVIGSVDENALSSEVELKVIFRDCFLEDPAKPGEKVR